MLKIDHKKAQAATELAVFGAILIFLIGTIVRSAAGNSYTQDQNFKAMRQAMLLSWQGSSSSQGEGAPANTTRNNASVIIVEDRLSPDIGKYGDLDRNPFIATGQGTFTYELEYPMDPNEVASNLPIQDVYINGQHFPFTNASYVYQRELLDSSASCSTGNSCKIQKCQRYQREWVANPAISSSQFTGIVSATTATDPGCLNLPVSPEPGSPTQAELDIQCQNTANANFIFNKLAEFGAISAPGGGTSGSVNAQGLTFLTPPLGPSAVEFENVFAANFPNNTQSLAGEYTTIQNILTTDGSNRIKLFYTRIPNDGAGTGPFTTTPSAACANGSSCVNNALNSTLQVLDYKQNKYINSNGDMQYDLLRLGNYNNCTDSSTPAVESSFPAATLEPSSPYAACSTGTSPNMRNYIAWQWAATSAISAANIGLDPTDYVYPSYDIDGRLKEVTIYAFSINSSGNPVVSYEDDQGGDIDTTWDALSCGPKPGIEPNAEVFTFTQNGTYLLIQEGKILVNPLNNQAVRSVNKRDTIDLIQRTVQLSNNTGRFCNNDQLYPAGRCTGAYGPCAFSNPADNPVEVCIDSNAVGCTQANATSMNAAIEDTCNCFTPDNIAKTCYDTGTNLLFVRSRLQDLRGHSWLTGTSGQLQVQ